MLHWEIIVIKTSWKLKCFQVLKAQRTAWKHPERMAGSFTLWACHILSASVFLFLVLSGIIGERLPIRCCLTLGCWLCGSLHCPVWRRVLHNIHSFGFYVITQVRSGPWLTTCWVSTMSWMGCSCHLCQEKTAEHGRGGRAVSCLKSRSALDHTAPFSLLLWDASSHKVFLEVRSCHLKNLFDFPPAGGLEHEALWVLLASFRMLEMLCPVTDLTSPELGDVVWQGRRGLRGLGGSQRCGQFLF